MQPARTAPPAREPLGEPPHHRDFQPSTCDRASRCKTACQSPCKSANAVSSPRWAASTSHSVWICRGSRSSVTNPKVVRRSSSVQKWVSRVESASQGTHRLATRALRCPFLCGFGDRFPRRQMRRSGRCLAHSVCESMRLSHPSRFDVPRSHMTATDAVRSWRNHHNPHEPSHRKETRRSPESCIRPCVSLAGPHVQRQWHDLRCDAGSGLECESGRTRLARKARRFPDSANICRASEPGTNVSVDVRGLPHPAQRRGRST